MSDIFKHKSTDESLITDQSDLDLIRQYTENWEKANAAGDEAGKQAAHDAAEKIRAKYQYSGGVDGSEYNKLSGGSSGGSSWLDKLGDSGYSYDASGKISAALDALLNREAFSYDATSDPLYQQYHKQYAREADRSAENALGKAAVMTGGMPSTAAVTASQQASDYQMSQLTDKIPELQQLAYSMYLDDIDADRQNLSTLIGLEDNNYNRWLDERNYLYQLARDQVDDEQYENELAYQKERDAIEDARYDTEWQYKLQQAANSAASGSSGGTSGGSNMTLSVAKSMAEEGIFNDDVLAALHKAGYTDEYISQVWGYDGDAADGMGGWSDYPDSVTASDLGKLDYDPDEGIFTWNGKRYNSLQSLAAALESADLSESEYARIVAALSRYGIDA